MAESPNTSAETMPSLSQFKALFTELLVETKKDILVEVKQSIDQVYTDFEVAVDTEMPPTEEDSCSQPPCSDAGGRW